MTLLKMIFITMFFGVLTGLSMDLLPFASNTHLALGLCTGGSAAISVVLMFLVMG